MSKKKNVQNGHRNGRDLYHRHYCTTCNARVFPYDGMESLTVAPELGLSKRQVLLFSYNSSLREKNPGEIARVAWCWVCNTWRKTYRENKMDTQLRYLRRQGISVRFPSGKIEENPQESKFLKILDAKMEAKRAGGGVVSISRR